MAVPRQAKRLRSYAGFLNQARSPMHSALRHMSYRALQPLAAVKSSVGLHLTPVVSNRHALGSPRGTLGTQTQMRTAKQIRANEHRDGPKLGQFASLDLVDPIIADILDPTVFVHPRKVFYALLNCQNHAVLSSQSTRYNTAIRIWKAVEQRRHNFFATLKHRGNKAPSIHEAKLYALHPQSDHYEALIRVHLATNHPLDIRTIIADMKSKSVEITAMVQQYLIRVAAVGGESPKMIEKCMHDLGNDDFSWRMEEGSLITAYCKRNDFESAFDVLAQIRNRGESVELGNVFPIMVVARHGGNRHLMQRAIEECEDTDGKAHTLRYFSFAFHGFGIAGDLESVKWIMVQRFKKGFRMDVDREFAFYNTCFRGDFEDAAEVAAQYVAAGEKPRHETIKALLGAYQLRSNHRRSMELIVFLDEVGWKFTSDSKAVWLAVLQVFASTGSAQSALKYIQHLTNDPEMYSEYQMSLLFQAIENNKMVVDEQNPITFQKLQTEWFNRRELIGTGKEILSEYTEKNIRELKERNAICPTEHSRMYSRDIWERMVPLVFFHPHATESRLEKVKENIRHQTRVGWAPRPAATTSRIRAATDDLRYYLPELRVEKEDLIKAAKFELSLFKQLSPDTRVPVELAQAVVECMFALDMSPEHALKQLEDIYALDRLAPTFWGPYQPIIDQYLKNHEMDKVLDLMTKLKNQNVVFAPSSFVSSFQECARTGDLDSALAVLMLAREAHVPITETMVLLMIDACCVAGDTKGLQGVTSLVAGKSSYDPLGQRTWASIIVKISTEFGLEAAQEIYKSLFESGDVRFDFKDAIEADETVTTPDYEHVEEVNRPVRGKPSTSNRVDEMIVSLRQGIQHKSGDVPSFEVTDMLDKINYTGRVDMEECIAVLKKHVGDKLTPTISNILLDLYLQCAINSDDEEFDGLKVFTEKVALRSAHLNVLLQHLTQRAMIVPSVKKTVNDFIDKVSASYEGEAFETTTPHLRAFNYFMQTRQVYQIKKQFQFLVDHPLFKDSTRMDMIMSETISMLIQQRDFKFVGEIFDKYLYADDLAFKFTDEHLLDFAVKLKMTQKIDGSKFSQSLFKYIKNVDGTNTDYRYKLQLIQFYSLWGAVEKAQMVYDKIKEEGQVDGAWANVFLIRAYTNDATVASMARAESMIESSTMTGDTRAHILGLMIQGYANLIFDKKVARNEEYYVNFSNHMGELVQMGKLPRRDTLVAITKVLSDSHVNKLDYFNKLYSKVTSQSDAGSMLRIFLKQIFDRPESLQRKSTIIIEAVRMRRDIDHDNFLFLLRKSQYSSQFDSYFALLGKIASNDRNLATTTRKAHMFRLRHVAQTGGQQQLATAVMEATQACRLGDDDKSEIRRLCTSKGLSSPFSA